MKTCGIVPIDTTGWTRFPLFLCLCSVHLLKELKASWKKIASGLKLSPEEHFVTSDKDSRDII